MEEEPLLICTVGLPRSGKTTWARLTGYPIVNPDSIRLALHGQRFQSLAEPFVWAIAHAMVRALFLAGHKRVVLDATNTTRKRRQEWLAPHNEWRTVYRHLNATREMCRARAADDAEILPVIERMANQFEPLSLIDEARWLE